METPGDMQLATGSSISGLEVSCAAICLLDFGLFTHLDDEGLGLVADNGGKASSCCKKKEKSVNEMLRSLLFL